ncbi:predicted protein [Arabidopsis lyrata subsp. lyrata]|uniref:Predicted protein n=1 Tax=Arabidopsis lyrata subsp. lyrata TaxID=81972 RepID=D7MGQ5_ARALL|nr:predicted protein [Arabidopsis lyrata subsp. lyrata]
MERGESMESGGTHYLLDKEFVATEIIPEMVDGRPVYSFSAYFQSTRESSSDAYSSSSKTSASDSENQAQDRESREEIVHIIAARGNANEA